MAEKVLMPKLGATMEEGIIDSWLVEVGEAVEEGDPLAEIQTDKITIEIEAETTGVLLKKLYDQGNTVPVQEVIAYIGEEGESVANLQDGPSNSKDVGRTLEEEQPTMESGIASQQGESQAQPLEKIRRTPIARRIAEENNLSLHDIQGTGPLGRIQKIDVEHYLKDNAKKITPLAKKMADDFLVDYQNVDGSGAHGKVVKEDILAAQGNIEGKKETADKLIPFKGMRKVIAERLSQSYYTAPHVTLFSEVDMTECVALRKQLLPVIEEMEGVRISYNEIIVKATAFSLKKNPEINVSLQNEKEIAVHSAVHIGFAVDVPGGLVVPVIKHADQKGLGLLTKEAKHIAKAAREGTLSPADMQGSTFTISNLGMFAVDEFTPIINQPNAAILGVGRIQEKPVVDDGEVKIRSIMKLSLSFDHRIVDGAPAARFLTDLKNVLEQPYNLMV